MGNGASTSQGSIPSYDQRDVRTSNVKEQHDWQSEQAVAPKQETQSLPDGRKPYSDAQREARESANTIEVSMEPSPPTEKHDGNVEADSSESCAKDDVIIEGEQRDKERNGDADAASIPDVGSDQPASTEEVRWRNSTDHIQLAGSSWKHNCIGIKKTCCGLRNTHQRQHR